MRLGKYELLCELATGGMGTVHVAQQVGAAGFTRLVAVKRLHPHLLKEADFRDMVRDEALVASNIRHPNVVPVVDVIEQEGELCLVLEYVPSVPLSVLARAANKAGERLPKGVISRILADALAGLHAAHEVHDISGRPLGIVHRDVSPQNVIVAVDGSARLIDFGIAKATVSHALTKSGELKGKLPYMSPEQIRREPLDRRSDVFAAGSMAFEVLTGARRFAGADEGAILLGVLLGGPCDLSASGYSLEVDEVINKALSGNRDERFATAKEFQQALEAALPPASHHEVAATLQRLCGARLAGQEERVRENIRSEFSVEETPPEKSGTRTKRKSIVVLPVVVFAAIGGFYMYHASTKAAPVAVAAPVAASAAPVVGDTKPMPSAVESAPPSGPASVERAARNAPPPATPVFRGRRPAELKKNPFQ